MMLDRKRLLTLSSFAIDIGLFLVLLLAANWGWFIALLLVEVAMWLIRLIWMNPPMLRFIIRRVIHMIPILLSVVAIGFLLIQLAPGDILASFRMNPDVRPETVERMERMFGLDQPWYVQFFKYLWNALHGEFGFSELYKAPVFTLVNQRAGNTLILAVASLIVAWGFSIPAGIVSATHQYRWQDQVFSVLAFIGLSIPNFFLGFLLIYFITNTGAWLPIGGMWSINSSEMNIFQKAVDLLKHLIVPTIVLATAAMAQLTRLMRANMLEIMGQQYVTTARAKGLKERIVINRHALRNAINPMITIFGFQLGFLLSGAALTETVLAWPGLGKLVLQATVSQDLYLVVGSLTYTVLLIVIGNLIADILLAIIDPRVRMR
jgi:peptide/nickel transport system permease protein